MVSCKLKRQPQTQHEVPGILSSDDPAKLAWHRIANSKRTELRMIPRIERVGTELPRGAFLECECLIERQIPVVCAGRTDEIPRRRGKRADRGQHIICRIEPLGHVALPAVE